MSLSGALAVPFDEWETYVDGYRFLRRLEVIGPGDPLARREIDHDLRGLDRGAGDREVLDGALGLRPVEGVYRDADLAHGVVFNAVLNGVGSSGSHALSFSHGVRAHQILRQAPPGLRQAGR